MSQLTINIGQSANDRSGDPLRTAFTKVNANFTELYANLHTYLPTPTGNSGKYLTTDGTNLIWQTLPTVTPSAAPITASSTAPSTHPDGTLWYDEVSGRLYVYFDGGWVDASPRGTGLDDEVSGRLYVYFDGGWVDASPRGTGLATSIGLGTQASNATGTLGQISYDSNYVYICIATNTWARAPLTGGY